MGRNNWISLVAAQTYSPSNLAGGIPGPPLIDDGEAERADPRLGADERHGHVVVAAVDQAPVASAGHAPVILHAAPDVSGVRRAVVAPQPHRNRSLVNTQSLSDCPVVCPDSGHAISFLLYAVIIDIVVAQANVV